MVVLLIVMLALAGLGSSVGFSVVVRVDHAGRVDLAGSAGGGSLLESGASSGGSGGSGRRRSGLGLGLGDSHGKALAVDAHEPALLVDIEVELKVRANRVNVVGNQ